MNLGTPLEAVPQDLPSPNPAGWQGRLDLKFAAQQGKSYPKRSVVQAPLKVQRPFYPESGVCHSVMLHTAGGVVGGDRLQYTINLEPQAQVLLTTAAAAKIYRSDGPEAQQTVHIHVDAGAGLEWLPQETIVFNGARYRQNLRVDLASEATWIGWEITRLGRSARGERFEHGEWRSHTEVWQAGRPVWIDPQWVAGGGAMMNSPHGLAGYPVIGSFAFVGQPVSAELVEQARSLWSTDQPGEVGVTRLITGMLCRYRGNSTIAARRWFTQVWHQVRLTHFHRPACMPRVWQ